LPAHRAAPASSPTRGELPTAAALALAPLIDAAARSGPLIVDAASGVPAPPEGVGGFPFAEVDGDFRAYGVLRHQTPAGYRADAGAAAHLHRDLLR